MYVISGKQFNEKFDIKFVKLTNRSENHHGLQFKTGLNIDFRKFHPEGHCKPGGIYFCEFSNLYNWLNYKSNDEMVYYRYVTIPDDANIYNEGNKFKADKLLLSE